jgi:predicted dehydrogenase
MAQSLRVGIIGTGWAGAGHAAAYRRIPGVTLAGMWGRTQSKAEALAGKLAVPDLQLYDRWEDLIEQGGLDVVSIAAPPALRRAPVAAALERGMHVLVEKPFTAGLAEARELVDMVRDAGTVTAVSFNWRYAPGRQAAWRALQQSAVGPLRSISMILHFRFAGNLGAAFAARPWTRSVHTGGGILRQMGSHEFDMARYLSGAECLRVASQVVPNNMPGLSADRAYFLLVELSGGAVGQYRCEVSPGEHEWRTVLVGAEGTLRVTHQDVVCQRADDDEPVPLAITDADRIADGVPMLQHTWNRLIADLCSAIRAGDVAHRTVPHLPTFADGLRTVELIAAAERAEAERRWVDLSELQR